MNKKKFLISLVLVISILITQVGTVFAGPTSQAFPPIAGTLQSITLETDPNTVITTVVVDVVSESQAGQTTQTVRINQKTAEQLGLVIIDGDGKPMINDFALGQLIEIDPTTIIPEHEETQHPAGSALATFFSNVEGLDYETIMTAHDEGFGFGVIAQALWLTTKLDGNSDIFRTILDAKKTGNYSDFILEDGTTPKSWEQFRKAILEKKNGLGVVKSNRDNR